MTLDYNDPDSWPWTDTPPTEPGYYWARSKAYVYDRANKPLPIPAGTPGIFEVDENMQVWIHGNEVEYTIKQFTNGTHGFTAHEWIAERVAPLVKERP